LLVNDPEETQDISARFILAEFDRVFASMTKHDVLARHEGSYRERPNNGMQPTP